MGSFCMKPFTGGWGEGSCWNYFYFILADLMSILTATDYLIYANLVSSVFMKNRMTVKSI